MPERENNSLTFKLVYYGPAQSGKTTNLLRLHEQLLPDPLGPVTTVNSPVRMSRSRFFRLC